MEQDLPFPHLLPHLFNQKYLLQFGLHLDQLLVQLVYTQEEAEVEHLNNQVLEDHHLLEDPVEVELAADLQQEEMQLLSPGLVVAVLAVAVMLVMVETEL